MYERILVPLDGSALSEAVLPHVSPLAKVLNAEIVLLHVVVVPSPEFNPPSSPLAPPEEVKKLREHGREYIRAVCARLEKADARATYLIREGAVGETILEVAETMQTDLIAMSTHGRSGLQKLLMGSVTEWVIKHSTLPVMVIRPK